MFNKKKRKIPLNYKRAIRKNFSCNNDDSRENSGKKIFKIRDRFFSPYTLSLLSKNNYNFNRNCLKNPTPNNSYLFQIQDYRYKSFDNQAYLNYIPKKKSIIKNYSLIEENDYYYKNQQSIGGSSVLILKKIQLKDNSTKPQALEYEKKRLLLVNQIIKFNLTKKKEGKKRNIIPMQFRKKYKDYIERRNKISFNPKYNSSFVHNMYSNFMIKKNLLKYKFASQAEKMKYQLKILKQKEEEEQIKLESRDQIEEMDVDFQKYKRGIKIFLRDETKLNQNIIHEEFFDSFANKINFIYDDQKFPTIKNNLQKIKVEIKGVTELEWVRLNMLEVRTLTYLHQLKAKIQRELDEIKEENKEKQFKLNQQIGKYDNNNINNKKKKKRKNEYKNEENDEDNFMRKFNEIGEEENNNKEEKKISKEELYNLEEFFANKGLVNKTIGFASTKLASIVYSSPRFFSEFSDSTKIYRKGKKNKEYFDIYL